MSNFQNQRQYLLVKIVNEQKEDGKLYWTKLLTLQSSDHTIIKIDKTNNPYSLQLQRDFGQEKILILPIIVEGIEAEEFYGDDNRPLKKEGMVYAKNIHIPLFKLR